MSLGLYSQARINYITSSPSCSDFKNGHFHIYSAYLLLTMEFNLTNVLEETSRYSRCFFHVFALYFRFLLFSGKLSKIAYEHNLESCLL